MEHVDRRRELPGVPFERVTAVAGFTDLATDVCAAVASYDVDGEFSVEFLYDFELRLGQGGLELIAVDCPLGFSRAVARIADLPSYRDVVSDLANGRRKEFLTVGARANAANLFSPSSSRNIARELRLTEDELLRECEKPTKNRMRLDASLSVRHTRRVGRSPLTLLESFSQTPARRTS
jgi:hypothetical protein